jgi:hypothetical protein
MGEFGRGQRGRADHSGDIFLPVLTLATIEFGAASLGLRTIREGWSPTKIVTRPSSSNDWHLVYVCMGVTWTVTLGLRRIQKSAQ